MTEFGFIDSVKELAKVLPLNGFEGIGDDCSILEISGSESLVFTADMLIEGVHFLRDATSAYDLGRKTLTVNLSDVAAMGLSPVASLLSLSIPQSLSSEWIEEFMRGYLELSSECGVALVGGDTTASKGAFAVNVTAIGRGSTSNVKRRSAANVGDTIFVTAPLGGSGAGLADILAESYETPLAKLHKNPTARIAEGVWLGTQNSVNAMMDISDGVASDLRHILKASGVGGTIELSNVPCHAGADLKLALTAGEDYELLFTCSDPDSLQRDFVATFGTPLYAIGTIVEGDSIEYLMNGSATSESYHGFTHY